MHHKSITNTVRAAVVVAAIAIDRTGCFSLQPLRSFWGTTTFLSRHSALWESGEILFFPATKYTFLCPKSEEATRFRAADSTHISTLLG